MMEEYHQVEIKQLYNISFDTGKECQIPQHGAHSNQDDSKTTCDATSHPATEEIVGKKDISFFES